MEIETFKAKRSGRREVCKHLPNNGAYLNDWFSVARNYIFQLIDDLNSSDHPSKLIAKLVQRLTEDEATELGDKYIEIALNKHINEPANIDDPAHIRLKLSLNNLTQARRVALEKRLAELTR